MVEAMEHKRTEHQELAHRVVEVMTKRSLTLATCESLTGGGIGASLTSVPGSSAVYRGGFITYASDLKHSLVGVDRELIDEKGVVNELTAIQMASGAQLRCDANWAVSTTGVAGPAVIEGQPVGTVWFAVVGQQRGMAGRPHYTELKHFDGDREEIRDATIEHAFRMLLRVL